MGPSHKLNMIARVCEHDAGPSTDNIRPDIVTVDFTQTKQQEYLHPKAVGVHHIIKHTPDGSFP